MRALLDTNVKFCQSSSPSKTIPLRLCLVLPRQQKENKYFPTSEFYTNIIRLQGCKELLLLGSIKSKEVNSCSSSIMTPAAHAAVVKLD